MGLHGDLAHSYFMQGYNCAQSVAAAFSQELGLPPGTVLRMSSGYGAGVGRLREVCGAFCGMVFVLSSLYGSDDPRDKSAIYARVQELAQAFRARSGGSIVCKELLGLKQAELDPRASARTAEYYKKRPCPQLVRMAADLMEEYLSAHPWETPAQPSQGAPPLSK